MSDFYSPEFTHAFNLALNNKRPEELDGQLLTQGQLADYTEGYQYGLECKEETNSA